MSVKQIDQALTFWENVCVQQRYLEMIEAMLRREPYVPEGPLKYLGVRKAIREGLNWSADYLYEGDAKALAAIRLIPLLVHGWAYSSRRVYRLSETLVKEALSDNSPPDCVWGRFPSPADAFALSLELPITLEHGGPGYDTIIVSIVQRNGKSSALLQGLPLSLHTYPSLPDDHRVELLSPLDKEMKAIREQVIAALPRNVRRHLRKKRNRTAHDERVWGHQEPMLKIAKEEAQRAILEIQPWCEDMRTGLCVGFHDIHEHVSDSPLMRFLYHVCDHIARGSRTIGSGSRYEPLDGEDLDITAGAEIFEIVSQSHQEQGLKYRHPSEPTGRTVNPHFRSGYYRRVAGSAPNAPKTQWVSSTWIHEEQARKHGMTGSTETIINERLRELDKD